MGQKIDGDKARQSPERGEARARIVPRPKGAIPLGFTLTEDGESIEPDPEGLATVELILRRRRDGRSYAQIADELQQEGHKTKRGGRWYPSTVHAIWRRRGRYIGFVEEALTIRLLVRGVDY